MGKSQVWQLTCNPRRGKWDPQCKLAGLIYDIIALWVLVKDPASVNKLESD